MQKILICGFVASAFYFALADMTNVKENTSEDSSYSKRRREASLMNPVYHGPSYKYLPPTLLSPLPESYSVSVDNSAGYFNGHISDFRSGYNVRDKGHGYIYRGYPLTANKNAVTGYNRGHHDFVPSSKHYGGRGVSQHFAPGFKGTTKSHTVTVFGYDGLPANRPNSYAIGHDYASYSPGVSNVGYKLQEHASVGGYVGTGSDYHFPRDTSETIASPASPATGLFNEYHADHVHNGAQEHVYLIANRPSGFDNLPNGHAIGQTGNHGVSKDYYLPPTKQYISVGYDAPIYNAGEIYNKKFNSQSPTSAEHGPAYAVGHKGLGYFSFTANKPQVLNTRILGSNLKQASYSTTPFTPSVFLGAKFEGSSSSDAASKQYLPPLEVGSDATGYDYQVPNRQLINFKETNYQQSAETQPAPARESDGSYLTPTNSDGSVNDITSTPSGSYLPPSNSYGVPYSH